MANTTFDGPVRSRAGFQSIGPGSTVALTLATDLTVSSSRRQNCYYGPCWNTYCDYFTVNRWWH
jgi:hypothetical protein